MAQLCLHPAVGSREPRSGASGAGAYRRVVCLLPRKAKPRPSAEAGTVPGSSRATVTPEQPMSTFDPNRIAARLTMDRLGSYLAATHGLDRAIELYDWNAKIGAAFHEDIGRLEVALRNTIDESLVAYGGAQGWPTVWYRRPQLFPGKHGRRALDDIDTARRRAKRAKGVEKHGKVIAELTFGFWRYLCTAPYLTSLWVPTVASAFPGHPAAGDPRAVRHDVDDRVQRVHFLRNRIAHHEPIHQRNLHRDHQGLQEVAAWICADTEKWIVASSRVSSVLAERP